MKKLLHTIPPTDIESWLKHLPTIYSTENASLIRQAAALAHITGTDHTAPNGQSCWEQGLEIADVLSELNVDQETLATGIIYSCVCYAELNIEDIHEQLGTVVAKLVSGVKKMDAIQDLQRQIGRSPPSQAAMDNLRKMLLAMVDDVRIVLVKLAERLILLRHMTLFTEEEKQREAKITLDIYAPLANRLGIGHLKWELEDLSFRHLEPKTYQSISKSLKSTRSDREAYVNEVIQLLKNVMQDLKIVNTEVTGRAKHIYSISKKMKRKGVDIEGIYDVIAFRILVSTIEECYATLGHVHSLWKPITKEFDDYIAQPKANDYRSIHTAVIGPNQKPIEIQIRTYDMHQQAELGVAAHWMYKEGQPMKTGYEEKINWLRQVMAWQQELSHVDEPIEKLYSQAFNDRVYVFTPQGDVIELTKDATPLDFAYHIHSDIGHRCRGAKINGQIVPLNHKLTTGECVEILTSKQAHPSRDWLNPHLGYLKTSRARAKVHHWFRQQAVEKTQVEEYPTVEPAPEKNVPITVPKHTTSTQDIEVEGVGNLLTHMALCCKPIPGDQVVGYITQGHGVSVHRQDCQNIVHISARQKERLIQVTWGIKTYNKYVVDLVIQAYDRHGLIRDITQVLLNENISILGLTCALDKKTHAAQINLSIEVHGLLPLSRIVGRIMQVPNVADAKRP